MCIRDRCTDSPYIAVKAVYPGLCRMPHMPISGSSGFDLYKEIGGRQFYLGAYIPSMDTQTEYEGIVYTGNATGEPVNYVLNFPPYNALCRLYIGLKAGSCTEMPNGYHNRKPVVFYGSSITQGACASRPGNIYQDVYKRQRRGAAVPLGGSFAGRGGHGSGAVSSAMTPMWLVWLAVGGVLQAVNHKLNLYLSGVMDSAVFFPIVNGGGLVLTTLLAVPLFRERLAGRQWSCV